MTVEKELNEIIEKSKQVKKDIGKNNDHVMVVSVAAMLFGLFFLLWMTSESWAGSKILENMPARVGTGQKPKIETGHAFSPKVVTIEDFKAKRGTKILKDWHKRTAKKGVHRLYQGQQAKIREAALKKIQTENAKAKLKEKVKK